MSQHEPNLAAFFAAHARMPRIGDEVPPWHYRGWLAFYVQEIQRVHPVIPDRWGYLAQIHGSGEWPREPIPRIDFTEADPQVTKSIRTLVELSGLEGWGWSGFRNLIEFMSFGLATRTERPTIPEETAEKLYRTLDVGPWLLKPWDYLGAYAAEKHGSGWNPNAFYPTPHPVCEAMVAMTMADHAGDQRGLTVMDPALGTGRFLLHASNYCMFLYGQDIDGMMCEITKVNGALYAPWLVVPPPDHLKGTASVTVKRPPPAPRRSRRKRPPPPPKRRH